MFFYLCLKIWIDMRTRRINMITGRLNMRTVGINIKTGRMNMITGRINMRTVGMMTPAWC